MRQPEYQPLAEELMVFLNSRYAKFLAEGYFVNSVDLAGEVFLHLSRRAPRTQEEGYRRLVWGLAPYYLKNALNREKHQRLVQISEEE